MENQQLHFFDLKAGRYKEVVYTRLLCYWEARNVKKGDQLMGVDMLLLDAKSTATQRVQSVCTR